jgi:hypothetical protein
MPTGGLRFTVGVWEIKSTKYKINSLNGFPIEVGVTFMFNSTRNGHTIDEKIGRGEDGCHGCTLREEVREHEEEDERARSVKWATSAGSAQTGPVGRFG